MFIMDLTENKPFGTPQSSYDPQKTTEEIVREKSKEVLQKLDNEFSQAGDNIYIKRYRVITDQDTGKTRVNETYAIFPKPVLEENGEEKIYKRLIATDHGLRVLKTTEKFEAPFQGQYLEAIGNFPQYYKHGDNSSKESLLLGNNVNEYDFKFTLDEQNGEYGTLERAKPEDVKEAIQIAREEVQKRKELRDREAEIARENAAAYVPEKTEEDKKMEDLDALNSIDF